MFSPSAAGARDRFFGTLRPDAAAKPRVLGSLGAVIGRPGSLWAEFSTPVSVDSASKISPSLLTQAVSSMGRSSKMLPRGL